MELKERAEQLQERAGFAVYPYTAVDFDVDMDITEMAVVVKADDLERALAPPYHIVVADKNGWGLQHPLRCRQNLTECEVHKRLVAEGGPSVAGGKEIRGTRKWRVDATPEGLAFSTP